MIARTSGTTEATIAPNANSRMMNVSGIVSRSESSRPDRDQLVDVVVDERAADRVDRGAPGGPPGPRRGSAATGAISGVTRVSSPEIRATIRTVVPSARHEPGLGRRLERARELVEGRRGDAVRAVRSRPAASPTRSSTAALNAGSVDGARAAVDDDEELLVRVVRPAGVEDVVGLARLELAARSGSRSRRPR